MEACEAFVLHKFLALPLVDYRRQKVGILDVDLLTNQVFDIAETERLDELFDEADVALVCAGLLATRAAFTSPTAEQTAVWSSSIRNSSVCKSSPRDNHNHNQNRNL